MNALAVIPARLRSTRLPYKPLVELSNGEPLLKRTWDMSRRVFPKSLVSTDDSTIMQVCSKLRIPCVQTSTRFENGSIRVIETAKYLSQRFDWQADVIVNWQVDEPNVPPLAVWECALMAHETGCITTICAGVPDELREEFIQDRNAVKVLCLPSPEVGLLTCRAFCREPSDPSLPWKYHVGVYAFPWDVAEKVASIETTEEAKRQSLEQISWMENGLAIGCVVIPMVPLSINTPEDLEHFRRWLRSR